MLEGMTLGLWHHRPGLFNAIARLTTQSEYMVDQLEGLKHDIRTALAPPGRSSETPSCPQTPTAFAHLPMNSALAPSQQTTQLDPGITNVTLWMWIICSRHM